MDHAEDNNDSGSAEKTPIAGIRKLSTVNVAPTDGNSVEDMIPKTIVKRRHSFSGRKRVSFDLNSNETFFFQRDDNSRYSGPVPAATHSDDLSNESVNAEESAETNKKQNDDQVVDKMSPTVNVCNTEASAETNDKRDDGGEQDKIMDKISPVNTANSSEPLNNTENIVSQCDGPSCSKTETNDNEEDSDYDVRESDAESEADSEADSDSDSATSKKTKIVVQKQPLYTTAR